MNFFWGWGVNAKVMKSGVKGIERTTKDANWTTTYAWHMKNHEISKPKAIYIPNIVTFE